MRIILKRYKTYTILSSILGSKFHYELDKKSPYGNFIHIDLRVLESIILNDLI